MPARMTLFVMRGVVCRNGGTGYLSLKVELRGMARKESTAAPIFVLAVARRFPGEDDFSLAILEGLPIFHPA
jgi:hypothetical protein